MRYLLDANAIITLLNDKTSPIARRVRRHAPRDFGVPAVVIQELYYGAFKSQVTHDTSFQRVPGLNVEDWKGSAAQRQRRNNP